MQANLIRCQVEPHRPRYRSRARSAAE